MDINRNNYEEYFLLYADNELSAQDKNVVENFVRQNPDLEEEFVMVQQSVLKPENIELEDKSFLFREGSVNPENYHEKFILYHDKELDNTERKEIEKSIKENPALQTEFDLFKQAKLSPDRSVVFPDKRSLYRRETRVISFGWVKYAAAAVLIGVGLWITIPYLQKNRVQPVVTKIIPEKTPTLPSVTEPQKNLPEKNLVVEKIKNEQTFPEKSIKQKTTEESPVVNLAKNESKNKPDQNKQPDNKSTTPVKEEVVMNIPEKNNDPVKTEIIPEDKKAPTNTKSEVIDKNLTNTQTPFAQPASYVTEDEKTDNYVFYNVTSENFKKSKVGIFLKKVARYVDRKNPLKDNSQ